MIIHCFQYGKDKVGKNQLNGIFMMLSFISGSSSVIPYLIHSTFPLLIGLMMEYLA